MKSLPFLRTSGSQSTPKNHMCWNFYKKPWRVLSLFGLLLLSCGCATIEEREAIYGTNIPIITSTFAKDEIRAVDTWKVYLNALDIDGDMKMIVCSIMQDGYGAYPVDTVRIKPEQGGELSGYLYLPAQSFQDLWNVHIALSLHIVDKAGHMSNEETLRLSFASKASEREVDKALFHDEPIGPIMIHLVGHDRGDGPDVDIQVR